MKSGTHSLIAESFSRFDVNFFSVPVVLHSLHVFNSDGARSKCDFVLSDFIGLGRWSADCGVEQYEQRSTQPLTIDELQVSKAVARAARIKVICRSPSTDRIVGEVVLVSITNSESPVGGARPLHKGRAPVTDNFPPSPPSRLRLGDRPTAKYLPRAARRTVGARLDAAGDARLPSCVCQQKSVLRLHAARRHSR
ncbi:hypothetical protein EVAR_88417_1 [Eumeta japonica]|uniref:Uncharacterized protein n=1 Tax=Eumeta variegata TaxID=151549 RepID=A0A4C1Y4Q6_EUMVA|nr:hypothetical protein EVAR_88417_1 [Eumeta japonica]